MKFVSFEYAGDVWQEPLAGVIEGLFETGSFCEALFSDTLENVEIHLTNVSQRLLRMLIEQP